MRPIWVTGFPKSGNTWLWRLLSDLLCAPMQECPDLPEHREAAACIRPGLVVRKTHLACHELAALRRPGDGLVLIWRDPRDMLVSRRYYWQHPTLEAAFTSMRDNYRFYAESWLAAAETQPDISVRYEELQVDCVGTLLRLWHALGDGVPDMDHLRAVAERQSFARLRPLDGHFFRKGIVGDWRNEFTRALGEQFAARYGDLLVRLGYEANRDWWQAIPLEREKVS